LHQEQHSDSALPPSAEDGPEIVAIVDFIQFFLNKLLNFLIRNFSGIPFPIFHVHAVAKLGSDKPPERFGISLLLGRSFVIPDFRIFLVRLRIRRRSGIFSAFRLNMIEETVYPLADKFDQDIFHVLTDVPCIAGFHHLSFKRQNPAVKQNHRFAATGTGPDDNRPGWRHDDLTRNTTVGTGYGDKRYHIFTLSY